MSPIFLLLLQLLSICGAESSSSRSILREISVSDLPDAAFELNSSNFEPVLKDSPASFAVVEFFAHWCPACRNYKPRYEKVARLFNGPDAVHAGIVFMTRVDCALTTNTKLCDRFSVAHYPMLLWGPPAKFASGSWEPKKQLSEDKNEIRSIDDGRTAESLLNWINKQLGSEFSLDDEKYENEHLLRPNGSDPVKIARAIYDVEEATANAFGIILDHKMVKSETRASLLRFLQLLVAHHPSRRCRKGSAEMLVNFDGLWPSNLLSVDDQEAAITRERDALKSFRICGKDVPRGYWASLYRYTNGKSFLQILQENMQIFVNRMANWQWYSQEMVLICLWNIFYFFFIYSSLSVKHIFCRGSKNDTRGFSCGLWVLLHSLSVRVDDGESHFTFTAICEFIHDFFICDECRQHFYKMCSSVSSPFNRTRDFALWLWSTHNKVNERLMKEEETLGTGDPKYPKMVWPPKQFCPTCYLSTSKTNNGTVRVDWNKNEVFDFLVKYYGKTFLSRSNEKGLGDPWSDELVAEDTTTTTNAVAVPVGAALAIALASCAFGALACVWRTRQKNRKPRKTWN